MKPRLRLLLMAVLASVAAYVFAPLDGSPALTVANPLLMLAAVLVYLPIVAIPAFLLPLRMLERRLGMRVLGEIGLRIVAPALLLAIAEFYALALLGREGGAVFSVQFALVVGGMVTVLFVAQILLLLQRNGEGAA
jgi:hypothetical protein